MTKKARKTFIYHIFIMAIGIVMIYPLIWMFFSSFKESKTILLTASQLIPDKITLVNYANGWKGFSKITFGKFIWNTLGVDIVATIVTVMSSALLAY